MRRFLILFFSIILVLPAHANRCDDNPMFSFTRALYLSQYDQAEALLPTLRVQRSPELSDFLQQTLLWKRAYDEDDLKQQHKTLNQIDGQVEQFKGLLATSINRNDTKINLGNIMFHAARMNIASGRLMRAMTLAKRANRWLQAANRAQPENANAYLALGLYQYYAGNPEDEFAWVKKMFSIKGDTAKGLILIEKAMAESPDYAFEAARSLMMELKWDRSKTCHYPELINPSNENAAFVVSQQAIKSWLYCGQTEQVQRYLATMNLEGLNKEQFDWLFEAKLYVLSMRKDTVEIQNILDHTKPAKQHAIAQFALARALDSSGERQQAQNLYQKVINSTVTEEYKTLARAHLSHYHPINAYTMMPKAIKIFQCNEN